jgi:hypothetical protein
MKMFEHRPSDSVSGRCYSAAMTNSPPLFKLALPIAFSAGLLFLLANAPSLQADNHGTYQDVPITPITNDPCNLPDRTITKEDCFESDSEGNIRWVPCPPCIEFSPGSGVYSGEISVRITHGFGADAVIRYTLDGRDPTGSDPIAQEETSISLNGNATIQASAWKDGVQVGEVASAWYSFYIQPLIFTPPPGTVSYGTEVSISCPTPGVQIFYTFDSVHLTNYLQQAGAVWEIAGPLVPVLVPNPDVRWLPYAGPIPIHSNLVITARAEKPGYTYLPRPAAPYELPRLPRPEFDPPQGPITNGAPVMIASRVPEATIRYTLDGSEPNSDSPEYLEPLLLSENTPLRARLFLHGFNPSHVRYTYYRAETGLPAPRPGSDEWPALRFKHVTTADRPVFITHAGDGTDRLFFVEESGKVRIVGRTNTFLEVAGNRTLISVAFPPGYDSKAHFYVSYFGEQGEVIVSRFSSLANPEVADPNSEQIILRVPNPYGVEIGGQIGFGPDGFLYLAISDPGWAEDPNRGAQHPGRWHGKMLRIDVEGGEPYAIPSSNPFLGDERFLPEIWAIGFRHPLRFSFDRFSGDLILTDVGQSVGEINIHPATASGGANYGWPLFEGPAPEAEDFVSFSSPYAVYPGSRRIVGGIRYRGPHSPRLNNLYIFGDSGGAVAGLRLEGADRGPRLLAVPQFEQQFSFDLRPFLITAFGEDEAGRIYVANYGATVYIQQPPDWHAVPRVVGGGIYVIEDDHLTFALRQRLTDGGKQLVLEWQSDAGTTYQVQFSTDLAQWENVGTPFSGTGETLSLVQLLSGADGSRFFRVVAIPDTAEGE